MLAFASVQTGTSHVCTYGLRSNSVKQSKRNSKETNCTLNLEDSVLRFSLYTYKFDHAPSSDGRHKLVEQMD